MQKSRPHSAEYTAVLASDRWRSVRYEALRRAGFRCQGCGVGGRLDGHHARGYRDLGAEDPSEIVALCRRCHDAVHTHARRQRRLRRRRSVLLWLMLVLFALLSYLACLALLHTL